MRDGGWSRGNSVVRNERMAATQRLTVRRLSAPKRIEQKYFDQIDEVKAKLVLK